MAFSSRALKAVTEVIDFTNTLEVTQGEMIVLPPSVVSNINKILNFRPERMALARSTFEDLMIFHSGVEGLTGEVDETTQKYSSIILGY